jgi:hypothetical protein
MTVRRCYTFKQRAENKKSLLIGAFGCGPDADASGQHLEKASIAKVTSTASAVIAGILYFPAKNLYDKKGESTLFYITGVVELTSVISEIIYLVEFRKAGKLETERLKSGTTGKPK